MIRMIEPIVGYMLKVLKSGIKIETYKDEFNAIRHGNYKDFLKLTNGPLPPMVKWNNGQITNESHNPNYDCDFEGLIKCEPSLIIFYNKCFTEYGLIKDDDISDEVYHKAVTFEIAIRMHANNHNLLNQNTRIDLEQVINKLGLHKSMQPMEIESIQKARRFVNMIKHYKKQFPSWTEGVQTFLAEFSILEKYKILIV